jgi:hypothetical protein
MSDSLQSKLSLSMHVQCVPIESTQLPAPGVLLRLGGCFSAAPQGELVHSYTCCQLLLRLLLQRLLQQHLLSRTPICPCSTNQRTNSDADRHLCWRHVEPPPAP